MKLKLETQDHIAILIVSESIGTGQDAILKAGLNKILQAGKKSILLDLTAILKIESDVLQSLQTFEKYVKERGGKLLVAHPTPELGHVSDRPSAIKIFQSDLSTLRATEASLSARLEKLTKQKKELEQRAQGLKTTTVNAKNLKREYSTLKKKVAELEALVKHLLKKRVDSTPLPSVVTRTETVQKTLVIVLEQEGILPVR